MSTVNSSEESISGGDRIFIRILAGKTFKLSVDLNSTVLTVKAKIYLRTGISIPQQICIFAGRRLEEGRTLASYHIQSKSSLHLVTTTACVWKRDQMNARSDQHRTDTPPPHMYTPKKKFTFSQDVRPFIPDNDSHSPQYNAHRSVHAPQSRGCGRWRGRGTRDRGRGQLHRKRSYYDHNSNPDRRNVIHRNLAYQQNVQNIYYSGSNTHISTGHRRNQWRGQRWRGGRDIGRPKRSKRNHSNANRYRITPRQEYEKVLKEWKLEQYTNKFRNDGWIEIEDWQSITEEQLIQMCFKPGEIARFQRKMKESGLVSNAAPSWQEGRDTGDMQQIRSQIIREMQENQQK